MEQRLFRRAFIKVLIKHSKIVNKLGCHTVVAKLIEREFRKELTKKDAKKDVKKLFKFIEYFGTEWENLSSEHKDAISFYIEEIIGFILINFESNYLYGKPSEKYYYLKFLKYQNKFNILKIKNSYLF